MKSCLLIFHFCAEKRAISWHFNNGLEPWISTDIQLIKKAMFVIIFQGCSNTTVIIVGQRTFDICWRFKVSGMRVSLQICEKYYDRRLSMLFWKNHPLQQIHLIGCIIGLQFKWIGKQEYIFFQLDDCTSDSSLVGYTSDMRFLTCKVKKDSILSWGLNITDLIGLTLHVYGQASLNYQELQVEYLRLCYSLTEEIDHWKITMTCVSNLTRLGP